MTPHGEVGPPQPCPSPAAAPSRRIRAEKQVKFGAWSSPGSGQRLPQQGGEMNPKTVPPLSPALCGDRAGTAVRKVMPVPPPNRGCGATGHPCPHLRPHGGPGSGELAMSPCPRPSHAVCARAQQRRECLALPGPAGAGRAGGEGMAGSPPPSSLCHPHRGAATSEGSEPPSPNSRSAGAAPAKPRTPGSGPGAASWERAMFSPSAPDDAGGFFGSGSLLRQREQNQSGCLVGLETNKTLWQAPRAGRSGQRGTGTGSRRPQTPGHVGKGEGGPL